MGGRALGWFKTALEEYTGRPLCGGRLRASLALYREIGILVERLYRHRRLMLPGLEGYAIPYSGFFLSPDQFRSCFAETIALLPARRGGFFVAAGRDQFNQPGSGGSDRGGGSDLR
jgi:hypothetical protein